MPLIALVGNQNSGKTTLFNAITGANQHVGNFPGITVEKKEGRATLDPSVEIVDLPGIYSLSPYTPEEVVTRDFIIHEAPDLVLNIIDATNLERNLYLTTQLASLGKPMILALNMMDEVQSSGTVIDMELLSQILGMPVYPIVANKKQGVAELVDDIANGRASSHPCGRPCHKGLAFPDGPTNQAVQTIAQIVSSHTKDDELPVRFVAEKILEGESAYTDDLQLHEEDRHIIEHIVDHMEDKAGMDGEAALADMRYSFIEDVVAATVTKKADTKEQIRSEKIDRLLTHKLWGIPIFIAFMALTFWMSFDVIGAPLQNAMEWLVGVVTEGMDEGLTRLEVAGWLHGLIIDGAMAGIGSVMSFLPIILVLFFFLSILEDSGYMARVSFLMDRLLRKIGLSGRSMAPLLIGFGCSVPAIMATRTLASDRDRIMTMMLTPFMSCSAKLPVYGMLTAVFFANYRVGVMVSLYLLGIVVAIALGFTLKHTVFKGEPVPFVLELPAYRMPSARAVWNNMKDKALDFMKRAFTIIFLASIVIWFLQSFNGSLETVSDSSESILAALGGTLGTIFAPLGFTDWRAASALVSGLVAKEAVVSTLAVLSGVSTEAALHGILQTIFHPLSAYAFLVFVLLYMPCVATYAVIRRELNSLPKATGIMALQTGIAYVVALVIYRVGLFFIG